MTFRMFCIVMYSAPCRSAESWTPICLPKFNDTGFLHAHVSYLPRDSPACLLLISTDKEKFFALQEVQKRIVEVQTLTYTMETLIRDTLNKGHRSIKDACFNTLLILLCIINL